MTKASSTILQERTVSGVARGAQMTELDETETVYLWLLVSFGTGTESGAWPGEGRNHPAALMSHPLRSFVVGSDGYVYEGRGWRWVGAHTRGHNSRGFGVAIVGNYTGSLPSDTALNTVRDVLPSCAIRSGHLQPDYKVLGHRQLVHSDCPGDALFNLLRTWPHFAEVSLPVLVPELSLSPLRIQSMSQVQPSVTAHDIVCPVYSDDTTSVLALPQPVCLLPNSYHLCWHPSDL